MNENSVCRIGVSIKQGSLLGILLLGIMLPWGLCFEYPIGDGTLFWVPVFRFHACLGFAENCTIVCSPALRVAATKRLTCGKRKHLSMGFP